MTFYERYGLEPEWYGKVLVMEIYHLTMRQRRNKWTITDTAKYFHCSIGLVSENLKIARALHQNNELVELLTRKEALRKINGRC